MGKWVYRPEWEYQEDLKKPGNNFGMPVIFALGAFFILFMTGVLGIRGRDIRPERPIMSLDEIIAFLPYLIGIPIIVFLITYIVQRYIKKDIFEEKFVICDRCGDIKVLDNQDICSCSGIYVDIRRMKWVEDENDETTIQKNFCINHIENESHFNCQYCSKQICWDCFAKFLIKDGNNRFGFCSDLCKSEFIAQKKKDSFKYRIKSIKYLLFSIAFIYLGYVTSAPSDVYYFLIGIILSLIFIKGLVLGIKY